MIGTTGGQSYEDLSSEVETLISKYIILVVYM